MDYNIFKKKVKKIRHHPTDILRIVARRGARLCDKRSAERNTNREGVASGSATQKNNIIKQK